MHLSGFNALNLTVENKQIVEVLAEGKESQVIAFVDFVKNNKPINAVVSKIVASDYEGEVTRIGEYAQVLTAMQMLKAIPTILEIRDNTKAIKVNTDTIPQMRDGIGSLVEGQSEVISELDGLRGDLIQNVNRRLDGIEKDMRIVKTKLGIR